MARRIHLQPHHTSDELAIRYWSAGDPIERSRWHFLWLLSRGFTATAIAALTGYSAYWIGQIARRYNAHGADGIRDQRHHTRPGSLLLSQEYQRELRSAVSGPAPGGDHWCGRTVAAWIGERLGRRVSRQVGWRWLRRIGAHWRKPRPRHIAADPAAQRNFKERLRPILRQVATAFPHSTIELWAVDEHRIGLKPPIHKVWMLDEQRPIAPVEHRFAWRYLVGFVHPASGRTIFHLATSVSLALFETELEAFATQAGAGPGKQVVLILDRAGWHASILPGTAAGRALWPLTNTALANQYFPTTLGSGERTSGTLFGASAPT